MKKAELIIAYCPVCGHGLTATEIKSLYGKFTHAISRQTDGAEILTEEPHCGKKLTATEIKSLWGAYSASRRVTRSGGRPRHTDRCPCGLMTARRAAARRHKC